MAVPTALPKIADRALLGWHRQLKLRIFSPNSAVLFYVFAQFQSISSAADFSPIQSFNWVRTYRSYRVVDRASYWRVNTGWFNLVQGNKELEPHHLETLPWIHGSKARHLVSSTKTSLLNGWSSEIEIPLISIGL